MTSRPILIRGKITAPGPTEREIPDRDAAGQDRAWRNVNALPQCALMIYAGAGVDNAPFTHLNFDTHRGLCQDLRPFPEFEFAATNAEGCTTTGTWTRRIRLSAAGPAGPFRGSPNGDKAGRARRAELPAPFLEALSAVEQRHIGKGGGVFRITVERRDELVADAFNEFTKDLGVATRPPENDRG